jgi:hypothetical protein
MLGCRVALVAGPVLRPAGCCCCPRSPRGRGSSCFGQWTTRTAPGGFAPPYSLQGPASFAHLPKSVEAGTNKGAPMSAACIVLPLAVHLAAWYCCYQKSVAVTATSTWAHYATGWHQAPRAESSAVITWQSWSSSSKQVCKSSRRCIPAWGVLFSYKTSKLAFRMAIGSSTTGPGVSATQPEVCLQPDLVAPPHPRPASLCTAHTERGSTSPRHHVRIALVPEVVLA